MPKSHEKLSAYIQFHSGASQDHGFYQRSGPFANVTNDNGSHGNANEVRAFDFQMFQYFNDFVAYFFEVVFFFFKRTNVFRLTVSAQINEQHIEVFLKCSYLLEPDGAASSSTVNEGYPFIRAVVIEY